MKFRHVLFFALISTFISFTACKDNKADAATETPSATSPDGTVQPPATLSTSASGSTEPHYKCATAGCTGPGSDTQAKCSVCGADLVHNQAFHNQAPGAPGSSPANPVQVNPTNSPAASATPPPAQNAKGVYHYSCAKGHEGGSAIAANCPKCGEAMTHNQAYHE